MLSKAQNKYIRSLTQQKYRKEHNVFIAEGDKIALEWLQSGAKIQMIAALEKWAAAHEHVIKLHPEATVHIISESELEGISALQTPNQVLLVVHMPVVAEEMPSKEWCLALDEIQDPGNMGTIIRIADWFGIKHIFCSPGCVDVFNPKVVQAAMGGHLRVAMHITDLAGLIQNTDMPVFAATLSGEDIYNESRHDNGILLIGNESKGISPELIALATHKIMIPRKGGAESLNAAVSAGIICALLMQR